jgi:hypothetical protein
MSRGLLSSLRKREAGCPGTGTRRLSLLTEKCKQLSESSLIGLENWAGAVRLNPIGILIAQGVKDVPLELVVGPDLVVAGLDSGPSTVVP